MADGPVGGNNPMDRRAAWTLPADANDRIPGALTLTGPEGHGGSLVIAQLPLLETSAPAPDSVSPALSRQQLVGSILEWNPTASAEFLGSFSDRSLRRYLDHLAFTHGPRGGQTVWVRDHHTPAIVQRENLD